jgi:hypothetical protein
MVSAQGPCGERGGLDKGTSPGARHPQPPGATVRDASSTASRPPSAYQPAPCPSPAPSRCQSSPTPQTTPKMQVSPGRLCNRATAETRSCHSSYVSPVCVHVQTMRAPVAQGKVGPGAVAWEETVAPPHMGQPTNTYACASARRLPAWPLAAAWPSGPWLPPPPRPPTPRMCQSALCQS